MGVVYNAGNRLVHIGGVMCIPLRNATIDDAWMDSDFVKGMIDSGELTLGTAPPPPVPEEPPAPPVDPPPVEPPTTETPTPHPNPSRPVPRPPQNRPS